MSIKAGSGHSAIEKTEATERKIREFEAAPCMEITAKGVAACCKTPGNLKSDRRDGDIVRYECIVCRRGHWRAFSEAGELVLRGLAANQRRTYELGASAGTSDAVGSSNT
jgi:hypothetical protein